MSTPPERAAAKSWGKESKFQRALLRGVLAVVRRPWTTLIIAAVFVAVGVGLARWRLSISTDQNKQFSAKVPFFRDYLDFIEKFPENEAAYIVIQSKDPAHTPPVERWTSVADAIAGRVGTLTGYIRSVDARVPLDKLGAQGLLFDSPQRVRQSFQEAQRFIPLARLWGQEPDAVTSLLGATRAERFLTAAALAPPDAETAAFIRVLAESWTQSLDHPSDPITAHLPDLASLDAADPSRLGYYFEPDQTDSSRSLLLIRVYPREDHTSMTALSEAIEAVRTAAREAAAPFPEFTTAVTGRPALEADELKTSDRDARRAEAAALAAVFIGLVIFLRSFWLAAVAEIALGVGIGWTFGYATLAAGELNLLSMVFILALIGIGVDYLIQILTRYRREAARHASPATVWVAVFRYIAAPINTACAGAAGAFFVSIFTDFRGAADLGIIAGGGLLLCLIAGYTVVPALLTLFPAKVRLLPDRPSEKPAVGGNARRWLVLPAVWIVALLAGLPFAARTRFDPGLLTLQAPNLESVKLVRHLQTWSAVVLSRDLDALRRARAAVEGAPGVQRTDSILTAYDNAAWLTEHRGELPQVAWSQPVPVTPTDLERIATKADALAARIQSAVEDGPTTDRATLDSAAESLRTAASRVRTEARSEGGAPAAARLSAWQTAFAVQLRESLAQFTPGPVDLGTLPPELRGHFISQDGTYALYIYPAQDLWDQSNLMRFIDAVEARIAAVPGRLVVTGIAHNVARTTAAIERAFYKAAAMALGLVLILVLLDLRRIGATLLAVSVLALGLPMLVALMGLLGVRWNFANFFGLPILIGAGHEYGVFLVHRYREARADPRRTWRFWDVSDRALLLCAYATCASFGFFWAIGHHEGLRSLGLVMALGIGCIYLAAVMVLRPILLWRLAKDHSASAAQQPRRPLRSQVGHEKGPR
jgi:predicted RND superfamily exporter protein